MICHSIYKSENSVLGILCQEFSCCSLSSCICNYLEEWPFEETTTILFDLLCLLLGFFHCESLLFSIFQILHSLWNLWSIALTIYVFICCPLIWLLEKIGSIFYAFVKWCRASWWNKHSGIDKDQKGPDLHAFFIVNLMFLHFCLTLLLFIVLHFCCLTGYICLKHG